MNAWVNAFNRAIIDHSNKIKKLLIYEPQHNAALVWKTCFGWFSIRHQFKEIFNNILTIQSWEQTVLLASRHHGSTLSGWQQNQRRRRRKKNGKKKVIGFYWQNNKFGRASRYFVQFFAVVAPPPPPPDMKLPTFTRLLHEVGEHNTKVVFFLF